MLKCPCPRQMLVACHLSGRQKPTLPVVLGGFYPNTLTSSTNHCTQCKPHMSPCEYMIGQFGAWVDRLPQCVCASHGTRRLRLPEVATGVLERFGRNRKLPEPSSVTCRHRCRFLALYVASGPSMAKLKCGLPSNSSDQFSR